MVKPYIKRIEQAAYDVLYNKKDWGNYSRERRNIYIPSCFTISKSGGFSMGRNLSEKYKKLNQIKRHTDDEFPSYKVKEYYLSVGEGDLNIWGKGYNRRFGLVTSVDKYE